MPFKLMCSFIRMSDVSCQDGGAVALISWKSSFNTIQSLRVTLLSNRFFYVVSKDTQGHAICSILIGFSIINIDGYPCINTNFTDKKKPNSLELVLIVSTWTHTRKILIK